MKRWKDAANEDIKAIGAEWWQWAEKNNVIQKLKTIWEAFALDASLAECGKLTIVAGMGRMLVRYDGKLVANPYRQFFIRGEWEKCIDTFYEEAMQKLKEKTEKLEDRKSLRLTEERKQLIMLYNPFEDEFIHP